MYNWIIKYFPPKKLLKTEKQPLGCTEKHVCVKGKVCGAKREASSAYPKRKEPQHGSL